MKVYITCPISHTKKRLHLLPAIRVAVESTGMKSFVFKVGISPRAIFNRDFKQLKSSDIIIAEVSERSHGVGIEIGLSYLLGLKRILIVKKGKKITKLAQGMPNTSILEYTNEKDLTKKLKSSLKYILNRK